jgi:hypothetical protein
MVPQKEMIMLVQLPPIFAIDQRLDGNTIQQLILHSCLKEATVVSRTAQND